MSEKRLKRALIANDHRHNDGEQDTKVAEIFFAPDDEADVKSIITGRDSVRMKVMRDD